MSGPTLAAADRMAVAGGPRKAPAARGVGDAQRRSIVLATESPDPSGMGRQMLTLGRGLAAMHRVVLAVPVATSSTWLLDAAQAAGMETWPFGEVEPGAIGDELRRYLARHAVDLVNVHAGIGWEGHGVVAAARDAGVRHVVRTEHLPFVLTEAREKARYAASLSEIDRIIAVSRGVAASHLAAGVSPGLIRTVRNGIEDPVGVVPAFEGAAAGRMPSGDRHRPRSIREALGIPTAAPLFVSVGRLAPQKGFDVLLAAAAEVVRKRHEVHFLIVGSGALGEALDATAALIGVSDAVHRLPRIDDVPSLLAEATAVVLASRFEGLPLVALEAMAVGRPMIASRVCGLDETVENGVTGMLVPPEDPEALAAAILAVLDDEARAATYGRSGRARFEAEFTAQRMVRETADVFEELFARTALIDAPATSLDEHERATVLSVR